MPGFAIYRLPYGETCQVMIQKQGQPEELLSVTTLSGKRGFVVAPFEVNRQHPVLLLHPDWVEERKPSELTADNTLTAMLNDMIYDRPAGETTCYGTKGHYAIDFANFHAHILNGEFSKIVLARCQGASLPEGKGPLELFKKACQMYPRMMVVLVSAQKCGTWLMATPEILLEGKGKEWLTMSLAGTMKLTGDQLMFDNPPTAEHRFAAKDSSIGWTIKNIQEQRFVSTYITECLEHFADDIEEDGPYTMRAGNLVHLRSDFHFTLASNDRLGELLQKLYPTPAVCGLPKEAARDFIVSNEYAPRGYYSGFVGPMNPEDHTHLYVSLRCMRIDQDGCALYAGGGLLANSVMDTEWDETEAKMETMMSLINT